MNLIRCLEQTSSIVAMLMHNLNEIHTFCNMNRLTTKQANHHQCNLYLRLFEQRFPHRTPRTKVECSVKKAFVGNKWQLQNATTDDLHHNCDHRHGRH